MKTFILTLILVTSVVAIVTTFNNGIRNTDNLHSVVSGQTFIVHTVYDIPSESNIDTPILKPKKLSRAQLKTFALSIGYVYKLNGEKIKVTSFNNLPTGLYIIRIGRVPYKYYKY